MRTDATRSLDLALMVWLSPSFPVGAFAYSHGLEWAVECGDVHDADSLRDWIADLLECGSIRTDVILLAEVFRAVARRDAQRAIEANDLAIALASSSERRLETCAQGAAFVIAARAAWGSEALEFTRTILPGEIAYPTAVAGAGAMFAAEERALLRAARAYALAFVGNLVSAAVRLGPIGQTQGQRVIAASLGSIEALGALAPSATLNDLGAACVNAELGAMRHETQYSRLFRS